MDGFPLCPDSSLPGPSHSLSSHSQLRHLQVSLHISAPWLMLVTLPEISYDIPRGFLTQFFSLKG